MKTFGDVIFQRRVAQGWSVESTAHKLRVVPATLRRWEKDAHLPQAQHAVVVKTVYGFTNYEYERLRGAQAHSNSDFIVKKFTDFFDANNQLQSLADKLDGIEFGEFPIPTESDNEYGKPANWRAVYEACHETGCVVTSSDEEFAGHWFFVPVLNDVMNDGLKGLNINKDFSVNSLDEFVEPGFYDVYFVSLFLRTKFGNAVRQKLLFCLQETLLELAEQGGIYIKTIFGNMSSPRMVGLATNMGFDPVCNHEQHLMGECGDNLIPSKIMSMNLLANPHSRILKQNARLVELYAQAQSEQIARYVDSQR